MNRTQRANSAIVAYNRELRGESQAQEPTPAPAPLAGRFAPLTVYGRTAYTASLAGLEDAARAGVALTVVWKSARSRYSDEETIEHGRLWDAEVTRRAHKMTGGK